MCYLKFSNIVFDNLYGSLNHAVKRMRFHIQTKTISSHIKCYCFVCLLFFFVVVFFFFFFFFVFFFFFFFFLHPLDQVIRCRLAGSINTVDYISGR